MVAPSWFDAEGILRRSPSDLSGQAHHDGVDVIPIRRKLIGMTELLPPRCVLLRLYHYRRYIERFHQTVEGGQVDIDDPLIVPELC